MKVASFWSWWSWSLLALNVLAEAAVLIFAFRRKMHSYFPFFVGYVGFSLLADVGTVAGAFVFPVSQANGALYVSESYSRYWWGEQIVASFIVLAMSVQLIVVITRLWESLVTVTAIVSMAGTAFMFYSLVEGWDVFWLRNALAIADLIAGLILLLLWIATFDLARRREDWPAGTRLITFGVASSILLQFVWSLASLAIHTMSGPLAAVPPVAALIGMVLFLVAVSKGGNSTSWQAKFQCPAL